MVAQQKKTIKVGLRRYFRASLVLALACCAALGMSACAKEIVIAGKAVDRTAAVLDLRDSGITDAESLQDLRKLRALTSLDLRDNALTVEVFDAIRSLVPKADIRWSVPLGAARYDSASEQIAVPDFSRADIARLGYFPNLTSLDASGSEDYPAMKEAQALNTDLTLRWTCVAAGKTFSNADAEIVCAKGTTLSDVTTLLSALPNLKVIDIRETDVLADEIGSLKDTYPTVAFLAQATLFGERYDTSKTSLKLAASDSFDAKMLGDQLAYFPGLTAIDLSGVPASEQDVSTLKKRIPALQIRWMVPLIDDLRVDSDTESLDLRGYTVSDLAAFKQKLKWLTKLTYLDMCSCGPSDAEMAQLSALGKNEPLIGKTETPELVEFSLTW